MKGFLALLALVALGLSAYNWWQAQQLRREVARLEFKLQEQQTGGLTDRAVGAAAAAIAASKDAIERANGDTARGALDTARRLLSEAGKTAGQKALPTVRWLEEQAVELQRSVKQRLPSAR